MALEAQEICADFNYAPQLIRFYFVVLQLHYIYIYICMYTYLHA